MWRKTKEIELEGLAGALCGLLLEVVEHGATGKCATGPSELVAIALCGATRALPTKEEVEKITSELKLERKIRAEVKRAQECP